MQVYTDPATGYLYTVENGQSVWLRDAQGNLISAQPLPPQMSQMQSSVYGPRCPRCGSSARIEDIDASPTVKGPVVLLLLFLCAVMFVKLIYEVTVNIPASSSAAPVMVVVAIAAPFIAFVCAMFYLGRTRKAKILRCSACGHEEITDPLPSYSSRWNYAGKKQ